MNRITEIELAGRKYPACLSMQLARRFAERYGNVQDVWRKLNKMPFTEQYDELMWILENLIQQGCAYRKLTDGEALTPPSRDDLEILVTYLDIPEVFTAIEKTLMDSVTPEIEIELKKTMAEMQKLSMKQVLSGANISVRESASAALNTT